MLKLPRDARPSRSRCRHFASESSKKLYRLACLPQRHRIAIRSRSGRQTPPIQPIISRWRLQFTGASKAQPVPTPRSACPGVLRRWRLQGRFPSQCRPHAVPVPEPSSCPESFQQVPTLRSALRSACPRALPRALQTQRLSASPVREPFLRSAVREPFQFTGASKAQQVPTLRTRLSASPSGGQ